jgi:hypothetical protein
VPGPQQERVADRVQGVDPGVRALLEAPGPPGKRDKVHEPQTGLACGEGGEEDRSNRSNRDRCEQAARLATRLAA